MAVEQNKVAEVIGKLVPIQREIGPYPDPKVPRFMYKLVKDDETYREYVSNPAEAFKREGINAERLDVDMFTSLARILRDRARGFESIIDKVAESISSKETSEGAQYNFDHSSSWFMNKEGWNVMYERGSSESKETSEQVGTDTKFESKGIGIHPDEILRHEINLLFFPAQPLVTPELVDKIKDRLAR